MLVIITAVSVLCLADVGSASEPDDAPFPPVVVATVAEFEMIESAPAERVQPADQGKRRERSLPAPTPPRPPEVLAPPTAEAAFADANPGGDHLLYGWVVESVYLHYPAIRQAAEARQEAIGETVSARGEFDDKLEAYTINQPLGFYENYRHGIEWKRPIAHNGGELSAGYRIGDGNFEPWYGERETDEGGEFKLATVVPLAQSRDIDFRRTQLRVALLQLQQTQPQLLESVLLAQREASEAYWTWVGAGLQLRVQRELQTLAERRVEQIERQIAAGDLARIVGLDNERLLASRQIKRIEADAKAGLAAYKLSLYFRDSLGRPLLPPLTSVPSDLPPVEATPLESASVIAGALQRRPELEVLRLQQQQLGAEMRLAVNQMLPRVDLGLEISQDVGGLTSPKGDKQPLELEAALIGSVPVQRRKALGKQRALRAKIAQLDAKYQLTTEKIAAEVGQAVLARNTAALRVRQAKQLVELARQTLQAGRTAFESGDIDILSLNIYEQSLADADSSLIAAEVDYFIADALRRIAAGELPGRDFALPSETPEHVGDFLRMDL